MTDTEEMDTDDLRPRWLIVAGFGIVAALLVMLLGHVLGPLGVILAGIGVFFGGRVAYRRIRAGRAVEQRQQDAVRKRADQQHRWAARGDDRGVYGTEGAELMREVIPPPQLPPPLAPRPPPEDIPVAEVVYTQAELDALLTEKAQCWRYAAFVSVLVQRRAAAQTRLRDARLGFAQPSGETASTSDVVAQFFADRMGELSEIVEAVDDFMLTPAFSEVFGDPHDGDSADGDGIVHTANRLMDYHDRLLALAERCRSLTVPHRYANLQRDAGLLMVIPLEGYQRFIEDFIGRISEMHDVARYASGDVQLDPVVLGITDDDELIARVGSQISQLTREG